jgi:hypothetical protein
MSEEQKRVVDLQQVVATLVSLKTAYALDVEDATRRLIAEARAETQDPRATGLTVHPNEVFKQPEFTVANHGRWPVIFTVLVDRPEPTTNAELLEQAPRCPKCTKRHLGPRKTPFMRRCITDLFGEGCGTEWDGGP